MNWQVFVVGLAAAVDEEGVPLVEVAGGQLLLGSDSKPLQLAYSSDGTMVALDSKSRPLIGACHNTCCAQWCGVHS